MVHTLQTDHTHRHREAIWSVPDDNMHQTFIFAVVLQVLDAVIMRDRLGPVVTHRSLMGAMSHYC